MCGRYRRTTKEEELARLYHIPIPKQTDLPISYNVAPSQKVLSIRFNPETRARSLDALQWGLIPYWAKDPNIAYRTINARVQTVDQTPYFPRAFAKRALPNSCGWILRMTQKRLSEAAVRDCHERRTRVHLCRTLENWKVFKQLHH
jgi:putative SOS response-associated peptidase YedK